MFKFINIHPATDGSHFNFNMSADTGSNYNVTKTTTLFQAFHKEDGSSTSLSYDSSRDLAQGTGFQNLNSDTGNDNDQSISGHFHLFNPSSTTFVKHFISISQTAHNLDFSINQYVAGYGNTASAVDAVQFKMSSGNIDSGTIKLYGIKDS
tara:strand:- start:59 stop:511 length:453 start_codon:yes stop_codon:yes gene_type:complete